MNGPTRFSAITLLAGVLIALPTHAAKLYKWVDADGNVTYSERRPPPESNAETIRLRSATIDDEGAQEKLDTLSERAAEQERDREFAENSATAGAAREERLANNCKIARENMRILKTTSRIQDKDANGEAYFLDEAAIQAKIAQTQQQIADNCK